MAAPSRPMMLALVGLLLHFILEVHSMEPADRATRLAWAREWLQTEFNVSTLAIEDQMLEMLFFIKKAESYRGMEIRVVSEDISTHRYERDVMAEAFTNITGIKIIHEIKNEGEVVDLLSQQVRTGVNMYDAYVSDSDLIGTHWRSCAVTSISDWILGDGSNVTLPSLDIHDFIGLPFVTTPDGKVYQLPDQQFANLYWFRYDLFTDPVIKDQFRQVYGYELGVPLDWSAYENIADFFTNVVREVNGTRIYGHMDYGKNDASLGWRFHDAWLSMAGASDQGEPNGLPVDEWGIRVEKCRPVGASVERGGAVNSPASIFAATKYIEWQLKYAPAGTLDLNFSTAGGFPSRGNIAQQIFWYTTFTSDLRESPMVTYPDGTPKWRMAPSPHGPYWEQGMKVGYQDVGSWTLLESTPLDRKAAAWLYAQFTVCKSVSLRKLLVGLTPIRESDIWSQAMTDMAPYLGGLVEFYRSPDRHRWSPTGTNVPDYPRLAPLWWKNLGSATLQAAAGGDPRTEATKAMDQLAHDMDAKLFVIGEESDHPCAPQLGPRRSQMDWLRQAGAPKEQLADEMPPGNTIDYDTLVQAWNKGMSINYDFGPDISRQGCHPHGPVGAPPSLPAQDPVGLRCTVGFLFDSACVPECPPLTHVRNLTSRTCEPRQEPATYTISNMVDLSLSWAVNEVAFFWDERCRVPIENAWQVVSSGDYNTSSALHAFDGVLATEWISNCTRCRAGEAFIGQQHPHDTRVRCLKVFQSSQLGSVASRLALLHNGVQMAVYEAEGGSWERWPMPSAGVLWRLSNGAMTDRNWILSEVGLYHDINCSVRLAVNFTVDASKNWTGTARQVFDDRSDSSWMSDCTRCPIGKAFVELEFPLALPEGAIQCVKVLQHGSLQKINLQRWNGSSWETRQELKGLGGGIGFPAQQRPLAADTMWRLRALDLDGPHTLDGWEIYELRMCADDPCTQPLKNFKAIASGELTLSQQASASADGDYMSWWAGGDNIHQWLGFWFDSPQQVRCFQVWQSADRWATQLVLERWDGQYWVESNSLTYWPASSGYFSSCAWGVEGTLWRLTHLQPLNGIWRIHEVEFFTDEACSQLIPNEYVIAASGQMSNNHQNHLELALDKRLDTFTALCDRHVICNAQTEYIGVDFFTPQVIRCLRVWQSGGGGGALALERRRGPGGLAEPPHLGLTIAEERLAAVSGSSPIVVDYATVIHTTSVFNERWVWANTTQQGSAADCRFEHYVDNAGWCATCGCLSCPPGSEPLIVSSGEFCHSCPAGRFSATTGSHRCEVCELGKFSGSDGQTACEDCPAGHFADATSRSQCTACPQGSAQDLTGESFCKWCSPGQKSEFEGQTACEDCSLYLWSDEGSVNCRFNGAVISFAILLFFSVWFASLLFFTAVWYTLPIEDAFTEEGIVTIKLTGHHWLLSPTNWWWEHRLVKATRRQMTRTFSRGSSRAFTPGSDEVVCENSLHTRAPDSATSVHTMQAPRLALCYIMDTGIPWLENPPMAFRALVNTRRRVRLLDVTGSRLSRPMEASIGYLKLPFLEALRMTGIIVPLWVILGSIIAVAAMCPTAGSIPLFIWLPEVCICILLGLASHSYRKNTVLKTSHKQRLARYAVRLRRRNPNPRPCPRGPGRAVTVGQLWDLYEYFHGIIGERDMYYVCQNILKPLTRKSQLSYAELAGPTELTWYVSHYWGTSFRSFVESVRKHAESAKGNGPWRRGRYWICSLGNNQWKVAEELGANWNESSFFHALRSPCCRGTVMVIDEDALPLTRSWCLFEVLQTFLLERDSEMFEGMVLCTESGILNHGATSVDCVLAVTKRLSSLRLENAQASMDSDKRMIDDLVVSELGGFRVMNHFLKKHFQSALLAARNQFEKQFEELADQLKDGMQSVSPSTARDPEGSPGSLGSSDSVGDTVVDTVAAKMSLKEFVSLAVEAKADDGVQPPDAPSERLQKAGSRISVL